MDKYEFNIKIEQIKKLVSKSDYETAMKIADTIDWRRVRNANLLSMVAQVYEKNEEYSEAKDILLLAFERAPIGKRLLYKLAELAIKENNIEEAEAYYREFCDLAPEDSRQHLLRYLILKEKGAPAEQLIHSLEQYTAVELDEKWMYELASLYHEAGYDDECVKTCDRIMLMFGIGKYVDKAMNLKTQYQPLTSYQMDLVENRDKYEAKLRAVENGGEYDEPQQEEESYPQEEDSYQPEDESYEEDNGQYVPEEEEAPVLQKAVWEEEPEEDVSVPRITEEDPLEAEEDTEALSIDQVLAAKMREAEEEERLARELSQLPEGDYPEDDPAGQTRILTDIKKVIPMPERKWAKAGGASAAMTDAQAAAMESAAAMAEEEPEDEIIIEDLWDEDDEEEKTANHLMIEARTPEKGLEMALDALKKIHKEIGTKQIIAKITGSRLNKKGIFAVADKIAGKDLVVEEAGDLSQDVLDELNQFMEKDETGVIVVLIDNPRQLEELHMKNPKLAEKFECIGCREESPKQDDLSDVEEAVRRQAEKEEEMAKAAVIRPAAPEKPAEEPKSKRTEPEKQPDYDEEYDDSDYEEDDYENDGYEDGDYEDDGYEEDEYEDGDYDSDEYEDEPEYAERPSSEEDEREMDIDEFAEYACKYAGDIDCSITGKSMLALYERIEIMEEEGIPLTRKNAEDLIEEAADKAEKPSLGKLITGVFSPKYNKDGLLILKEEHFI